MLVYLEKSGNVTGRRVECFFTDGLVRHHAFEAAWHYITIIEPQPPANSEISNSRNLKECIQCYAHPSQEGSDTHCYRYICRIQTLSAYRPSDQYKQLSTYLAPTPITPAIPTIPTFPTNNPVEYSIATANVFDMSERRAIGPLCASLL